MRDDEGQSAAPVAALSGLGGGLAGYAGAKRLDDRLVNRVVDNALKNPNKTKALNAVASQLKRSRMALRGGGALAGALAAGGLGYAAHKGLEARRNKSASVIGDRVIAAMKDSDRKLGLDKKAFDYIGDDARQALLAHNKEELGDAGQIIGGVGGGLGGAALGAGAGALAGKKYLGGRGRGAALGTLAGGIGGGVAGLLAGPGWGESKAQEATSRDVDQLNALADQQYQQQLAQQQAQMQQQYEQLYAPHQYKQSDAHIDKMAETEAVPVPESKDTSTQGPPSRNNFFAPHITGDYGHQQLGVEHSLQRTPALPVDGVTNVVRNR